MKDAYYFPHDCNARNDQKLIAVRAKHGMKGYGIYFGIVEMLREANGYQISSKIDLLAFDLREEQKDIKDILENYNLFETDGVIFWSPTLIERMKKLSEVREKRRVAGKEGGLAKARNLLEQTPSKNLPVKESKVKESKVLVPNGTTKLFIDWWYQQYLAKFNRPYLVNGSKDGSLIKKMVGTFGIEDTKARAKRFLASEEPFIIKAGYTIGVFYSQINRLNEEPHRHILS